MFIEKNTTSTKSRRKTVDFCFEGPVDEQISNGNSSEYVTNSGCQNLLDLQTGLDSGTGGHKFMAIEMSTKNDRKLSPVVLYIAPLKAIKSRPFGSRGPTIPGLGEAHHHHDYQALTN